MADNSLNESFVCINYIKKGREFSEIQKIHLSQIKLLINKSLEDFSNQKPNENYLYFISYFIEQIRQLNEKFILLLKKMESTLKKE
jgi:hypothetical protein